MELKNKTGFKSKKRLICLLILGAFSLFEALRAFLNLKGTPLNGLNSGEIATAVFIISVLAGIAIFIVSFYILSKQPDIHKIYLFTIIVLGLSYMILFLPFTVPDEPVHYFSAYRTSNYFLFKFNQFNQTQTIVRQSDKLFYEIFSSTSLSANQYHILRKNLYLFSAQNDLVSMDFSFIRTAPIGYIASGLAIAIARILHLSPVLTFYSGRIANILLYSFLTYIAIKKIPFGKMMIFSISVLPMTLHLIASYSYDFIAIAFAILFVSQVLYIKEKEGYAKTSDILLCALYGMILAPSKLVYAPMLLFAFVIPSEKLNCTRKKAFLIKSSIVLAGAVVFLVVQSSLMVKTISVTDIGWAGTPDYSLSWILSNPFASFRILLETIYQKGEFYLTTLVGGSLGWFQFSVPNYCYIPFLFILCYSFMRNEGETAIINLYEKLFVFIIVMIVALLVLLSMFIGWTPLGYPVIEGVQGRYFLPLLPLIYLMARNKFVTTSKNSYLYITVFTLYFSLFFATECFLRAFK